MGRAWREVEVVAERVEINRGKIHRKKINSLVLLLKNLNKCLLMLACVWLVQM